MIMAVSSTVKGQEKDTLKIKEKAKIGAGFFFVPQGEISLMKDKRESLFKTAYPLFEAITISYKKVMIAPFYLLTNNSMGMLVEYKFHPKLGLFVIGTKSILINSGKVGIALFTSLDEGKASGFVEFCLPCTRSKFEQSISVGIILPFLANLNKK
jgi:hypothetical protein